MDFCLYFCAVLNHKIKSRTMKKSFLTVAIAGLMLVVACGPSAEEIAAEKKRVEDSIAAVRAAEEAAKKAAEEEAARKAAEEAEAKRIQDSIAAAEAAAAEAKAKKSSGGAKKAPAPAPTPAPANPGGRGGATKVN